MSITSSFEDKSINTEFITPSNLIDDIINKIPEKYFISKDSTFLDPFSGRGGFIKSIIKKLKKFGHSNSNISKRVFANDLSIRQINYLRRYFDNKLENTSTLDILCNKESFNMKFDVIVGNPPYNITDTSGSQKQSAYIHFIEKLIENAEYHSFVIPANWLSHPKDTDFLGKFKTNMIKNWNVSEIIYFTKEDAAEKFSWPSVIGGVCYFVSDKNYRKNTIKFVNKTTGKTQISDFTVNNFISPEIPADLIERVYSTISNYPKMSNRHQRGKIGSKEVKTMEKGNTKVIASKGNIYYVNAEYDNITKLACKYSSEYKISDHIQLVEKDTLLTESFMYFEIKDNESYESMKSYLSTSIVEFLRLIVDYNHNNTKFKWLQIPEVPFDRIWDEKNIYSFLNINKEDQEIIKEILEAK